MSGLPLVSVIVVCFNHARFLEECLDSIDAQDYPNVELIIADDASTDGSQDLIRAWAKRRDMQPVPLLHGTNRGLCATLNEGLACASGDYVSYISTDDVMEPLKLSDQVRVMQEMGPDVAVVYSDAYVIDENGNADSDTYGQQFWRFASPPAGDVFDEMLHLNFVPAVSALMRRSAIDAVGGYDESLVFEDWDMWLRMADRFEFAYSPYISVRHRFVKSSLYHTRRIAMAESKIKLLQKWLDDSERRPRVIGRIRQEVHYIYSIDRHKALPGLALLAELDGGWTSRGRYLLARAGVSYQAEQWAAARLRSSRGLLVRVMSRFRR